MPCFIPQLQTTAHWVGVALSHIRELYRSKRTLSILKVSERATSCSIRSTFLPDVTARRLLNSSFNFFTVNFPYSVITNAVVMTTIAERLLLVCHLHAYSLPMPYSSLIISIHLIYVSFVFLLVWSWLIHLLDDLTSDSFALWTFALWTIHHQDVCHLVYLPSGLFAICLVCP